jgi:hypothetical protein
MGDFRWIRSSYSSAEAANCVEITVFPNGGRAVRDSKNPDGSVLMLTAGQWADLIKSLLLRERTKQLPNQRGSEVFSSAIRQEPALSPRADHPSVPA